jgi:hypothetical protein
MLPLFQVLIFGLAMEVLREVKVSSLAIAFASIRIASKVPQVLTSHSYYPDYAHAVLPTLSYISRP